MWRYFFVAELAPTCWIFCGDKIRITSQRPVRRVCSSFRDFLLNLNPPRGDLKRTFETCCRPAVGGGVPFPRCAAFRSIFFALYLWPRVINCVSNCVDSSKTFCCCVLNMKNARNTRAERAAHAPKPPPRRKTPTNGTATRRRPAASVQIYRGAPPL